MPGALSVDDVDFIADVDPVRNRLLVAVLADDVLAEEAVGAVERAESKLKVKASMLPGRQS
jgi:hypothetical protein